MNTADHRPWYRQLWPWLLMLPPAFSVAGGVTMLYLAASTPSALVVDDYARIDEITSERFARDTLAAGLGLSAEVDFAASTGRIALTLISPGAFPLPRSLSMRLRHATNPAADRDLELVRDGDVYTTTARVEPGRYWVELMPEDGSWRLAAGEVTPMGRVSLEPQAPPAARR